MSFWKSRLALESGAAFLLPEFTRYFIRIVHTYQPMYGQTWVPIFKLATKSPAGGAGHFHNNIMDVGETAVYRRLTS